MGAVAGTDPTVSWERAVADWPRTHAHRLLRAYGDELNARLAESWLAGDPRPRTLLKTDLFDEAVGEGVYPRLLPLAESVTAVDVSQAVVDAARGRYPELSAVRADVRALPFPDGAFDAVVSFSTLDHFRSSSDLEQGLAELARVLAPGGRLLVTLDNAANPLVALRNTLPWRALAAVRLVPCYVGATCGPAALEARLRSLGLEIRETATVMHVPRVAALALSAVWPRRSSPVPRLADWEGRLSGLRTHSATGQFVAALAGKPA